MNTLERRQDSKYVYKGSVINLRLDTAVLPNGNTAKREVIEHPGGVCVLPIDKNGDVLLVKQFRYPYMAETLEVPAGKRDKVGDRDPLSCGKRELKEETGASAKNYIPLGTLYPSPGYTDEVIYMYAATGLSFGEAEPDEDEFINLCRMPLKRAAEMVMRGEIPDSKTQVAVLKAVTLAKEGKLPLTSGKNVL
ncbi:MAG: NUDIX hydrolase [Clostridia bacterium]|nr:NUDIX hydrolase [Clostridia bacterium]